MSTNLPPARERIEKAAAEHGWVPRWTTPDRTVRFTRSQEEVTVTFTDVSPSRPLAQRVKSAWSTQPITGADKAGQVIARLSQSRAL